MSTKISPRFVVGLALFSGTLFLYTLSGPYWRQSTLLPEARGQELVAARPVTPDQRLKELEKQRKEEEERRLRELKAKQAQQLQQAQALLGEEKFDEAEQIVKGVLAETADHRDAKRLLKKVSDAREAEAERERKLAEAEARKREKARQAELKEALDGAPKLLADEKFDEAEGVVKGVLAQDPEHRDAKRLLQEVAEARTAKAEQEQKLAEEARLERLKNKLEAAEQAADQDRYDEAIKLATEILTEDPKYTKAQDRVALWTKKKRELEEAQRQAAIAPQLEKLEADILGYLKERGFQQARQAADKMLSLDPKNRTAQRLSMRIDAEERAYQKALAEQKIAAALAEAERLAEQKNFEAALMAVRESVLAVDPDNPKGAKLVASIERQIAQAEQQKREAELASAEALIDEGKLDEAVAAINKVKVQYPDLAGKADAALAKVEQKRLELEKAAEAARVAEGERALDAALALLEAENVAEAVAAINKVKAEHPSLARKADAALAKAERKRLELEKAAAAARVAEAEQAFDAAMELLNAGKVDEAEAALRKINAQGSESLAKKVAEALEEAVPTAKAQAPLLRARADLARAESLAEEGKFDEAQKTAEGVKATMPDLQREADRVLARIGREKVSQTRAKERDALRQANSLIGEGKLDEAETLLKGLLASGLLEKNEKLQALLVTIPAEREKAAAAAEKERIRAELARAESLAQDGKLEEARKAAEAVKAQQPGFARDADRILAQIEKLQSAQLKAQEKEAIERAKVELEKAEALLMDGKLAEARKMAEAAKAAFPAAEGLADRLLAKIAKEEQAAAEAENKAALAAKIQAAEAELAKAQQLVEQEKLADAEKLLLTIPGDLSRAVTQARDQMLNVSIPKVRRQKQIAEGQEQLARADSLLKEKRYAAARGVATGVKATFPYEVGRDADALLVKIDGAVEQQARELLDQAQFDGAEELIKEHLEGVDLEEAKDLRALLAKVPQLRAKAVEGAKLKQLEDLFQGGLQKLADGDLPGAKKAMEQVLASPDAPDGIAAKARRVLERDIPEREKELKIAAAKRELDQILAVVEAGDTAKASQALEKFLGTYPDLEKEAGPVRRAIEAKEAEQAAALEKQAVQRAQDLVDAGKYDEALQQVEKDLATPVLAGSVPLQKLREAIPAMKAEGEAEVRIAEAMKVADAARDLIEQGELDRAEAALKQIDPGLSKEVARKIDQLQDQIKDKREEAVIAAAKTQLAAAQKDLAEGDLAAARTAALAAAQQHRAVEAEAKKIIAQIETMEREKVLEAKRARLAEGDKLLDDEKYKEAVAVYQELEEEGYFAKEIASRKRRIEEEAMIAIGSIAQADKILPLFKAADAAHEDGDFNTERDAIQTILVWDPENKVALRRLEEIDANLVRWEETRQLALKVETLLREAKELEDANDLEGALAKYKGASELDPKSEAAREGRTRVERISREQGAQVALAVQVQRAHRAQLVNKWLKEAEMFHKAGKFEEAANLVNRIVALGEGSDPETRELLARLGGREVAVVDRGGETADDRGPTRPVTVDEKTRAEELLEKISAAKALELQEREFRVKNLCDQAEKQLKLNEYDKAIELIREAETWDKEDDRVQQLKVKWMILTGTRPRTVGDIAGYKEQQELVKLQMNIEEMEKLFRAANTFLADGDYDEAIDRYEKVRAILRTLPDREELKAYRAESARKLDLARGEKAAEARRITQEKEVQARDILQRQRQLKIDLERRQRSELLSRARAQMEQQNYGLAQEYARELLNIDPLNVEARSLLNQLDRERRSERLITARQEGGENMASLMARVDETSVPITSLYEYPKNWQEIIALRPESVIKEEELEKWKRDVRDQMEKRISFDFVDTPLADVVAFLSNLTGTNMVLDPVAVQGDDVPVTLKVNDMRLGAALEWILKLVNLTYALQDEAIFISTKERVSQKPRMEFYEVRDLLATIPDYSGSGLPSIGEGGGGDIGGGGDDLFADEGGGDGNSFTGEELVEFIREIIEPSSWGGDEFGDDEDGGAAGTISYRQGKLIIIQTPEIHRQIEGLLSRFRESAALQVHISARFIDATEDFMRAVGLTYPSLNINTGLRNLTFQNLTVASSLGAPSGLFGAAMTGLGSGGQASNFAAEVGRPSNLFTGLLTAAEESRDATTLQSPELTCFNGQQARIAVVTQARYIEDAEATSTSTSGGGSSRVVDPEIGVIEEGVNFLVRPTVSSDKRYVTLDLQPVVSDILRMEVLELTLAGGSPGPPPVPPLTTPIQLPVQSVKLIQTSVSIPDGGTLLIGGLMETTDQFEKSGVPYLDRIPILRALVGQRNKIRRKRYLIIFIKANVLVRDEMEPPERG